MNLDELANKYRSDKGTRHRSAHGYTMVYEPLFHALKEKPISILEMGLAIGGPELGHSADRAVTNVPSISMWKEYFPSAHIHGFDISDFSTFSDERFTFTRGDSGNRADLAKLAEQGPFDIVIDDASHASYHQLTALSALMNSVKPGGFYIIEDLQWQPATYERELPKAPKVADLLLKYRRLGALPSELAGVPDGVVEALDQVHTMMLLRRDELDRGKRFRKLRDDQSGPRGYTLHERWRVIRNAYQGNPLKLAIFQKNPN
jgi:hypothetical protein